MWGTVRNSVNNRQVAPTPQSPPPPYKSRQNSPQSDNQQARPVRNQPDRNVYHGNSPNKERYVGKNGGNARGGKCGECCLGVCCCLGGPACCPFPGRDKNQEGCCKNGCCRGPCLFGCCCGEGVFPHLDPNTSSGRGVPGSCCGAPYESLNDTHKPRRCRRLGALLLFLALPLLLLLIALAVYFGLQAASTASTQESIQNQAPGGYYQNGVYFYPVPQNAVDQYYKVIGQEEIDECWRFLEEIGVTLTTTGNGSSTTTPVTTVAETVQDTTVAATTVAATVAATTVPVTVAQVVTETAVTAEENTATGVTEAITTVAATTVDGATTVEFVTTVVDAETTTVTTLVTATSYMGTIPNCFALTTTLESLNTPLLLTSAAARPGLKGELETLLMLGMVLLMVRWCTKQ